MFPIDGGETMDNLRQRSKWNMESHGRDGAMFVSALDVGRSLKT